MCTSVLLILLGYLTYVCSTPSLAETSSFVRRSLLSPIFLAAVAVASLCYRYFFPLPCICTMIASGFVLYEIAFMQKKRYPKQSDLKVE